MSIQYDFFPGQGEMSKRLRGFNWSRLPLGPIDVWPSSIKSAFQLMLASHQPACIAWGPDLRFFYNDAYIGLLGDKHPDTLANSFWTVFQDLKHKLEPQIDDVIQAQPCVIEQVDYKIPSSTQSRLAVFNFSFLPIRDDKGMVIGILGFGTEITKQFQAEKRFQKIVEQAATGVVETDAQGNMTLVNRKFCAMLGYEEGELLGKSVVEITYPGSIPETLEFVAKLSAGGPDFVLEKKYIRKDKSLMWAVSSVSALRSPAGEYQGLVAIVVDITARKNAEEEVRHASLHDLLTGLSNRAMLFEYASHLLPHNKRNNLRAAILFLDLDRFKPINDTHGHEIGDMVLKLVAARLTSSLRSEDVVIRLGGDEFVILLQEIHDAMYVAGVAKHLISIISEPYSIGELNLLLSTSIGISIFPENGDDIGTLISRADTAMYQAKQAGRNNFQFYSSEYGAWEKQQLIIEHQLRRTLKSNNFQLFYQPLVDITSGDVVSVEALLRWRNQNVGPDRFVPIAEASGIINPIGRWILHEASQQYRRWAEHGLPAIPVAVNVSVVEFRDKDFADKFEETIHRNGITPTALQLEVTETAAMDNLEHTINMLSRLKSLGIQISLDDFGTGYSSLSHLARLPLNKVKIDKSFVSPVEKDTASRAVTDAVIALGRTLRLEVVAEGVESQAVCQYLRTQGCTQAQGYYFGKPMTGDSFELWFHEYNQRPHDIGPRFVI